MTLPRRRLTITFERSITAGVPNTMEIAIIPLAQPDAPELDITLVGGTQTQTILLANEANPVFFDLVPTDSPGLSQRVLYRIAWRERYMGRQYTADFVMPDTDCSYADLGDLGAVLDGTTYVQWTDRGRPNGVAALNALGQVVDADNNPVIGGTEAFDPANFTASHGVMKVSDQVDGVNVYEFQLDPATAGRKWVGLVIPAAGNFGTIVHNLGAVHVLVQVYHTATRIPATVAFRPNLDGNTVAVEFDEPPLTGQYTAVVIG